MEAFFFHKSLSLLCPFVALKHNLTQKTKQLGLDFRIREQTEEQALVQASFDLILVSFETAASHAFARVVRGLIEQDKVSRVMFDEVHLIDTQKGFRHDFYKLGFFGSLLIPLFFVPATLTSASVDRIYSVIHLRESQTIRANISNPNIIYLVKDYPAKTPEQDAKVAWLLFPKHRS